MYRRLYFFILNIKKQREVFVATFGWFSVFHLLMIAALLIPNGIYMLQNKQTKNKCTSRCMNVLEQIGRYGCMLLMILSVKGGTSDGLLAIYEAGSLMCLLLYVLLWRHLLKSKAVYAAFVPIAVLAVLFALLSPVLVVLAVGLTGIVYVMMRASRCTCKKSWICMALAIVPALLFLLCGITLHAWMLTAVAVIFALSHPYVTWCNVQTD